MKKHYISPDINVTLFTASGFLCGSGVHSDDKDIGYGGVDDGTHTPGAPRHHFYDDDDFYDDIHNDNEDY